MVKRLMAKTGQYEKDGETKGRYVEIGVILSNDKGEYALLDPAVNLAGVLVQQRMLSQQNGSKAGDRVMVSIFDNDQRNDRSQSNQQGGGSSRDLDDEIQF